PVRGGRCGRAQCARADLRDGRRSAHRALDVGRLAPSSRGVPEEDEASLSFQSPWWLLALIVIPTLIGAYIWRERRREQDASAWASPALIPNLIDRSPGIRRHLPIAILLVALAAMIFGVARPHATVTVRREEATVLLAIDTSRSMGATDVSPTRLRAAQTA